MPPPGGIKRWSASVVRLSDVAYIGSNSKTKRLGRRNFAQGYPRSHATPTPTSRSKGQKSRSRAGAYCGGHLAAQLVILLFRDLSLNGRKFGVSWRSSSTVARARRGVPVHCPAGTKSLPDTLRITGSSMTSLWRRETVSKKSVRDITRISSFVTTMILPHVLQIYSTVSVKRVCGCISQGNFSNKLWVKWQI